MKKILCGLVLTALCLTLCACGFTAGGTYPNADKYTVGNFTYDAASVEAVDISWISGRVELIESDGGTLNVTEKQGGLTDDQLMRWWLDGTTLRIQYWKSGYTGTLNSNQKRLTMEIPRDIALTVHVTSGEIIGGNHQLKEANLSATSGEIELGAVNADNITVEMTSGGLKAGPLRAAKRIAVKCTSGEIKIDNAMADTVTLQSTSGKIEAGPIDAQEFTAECTSGDIKLEAVKADSAKVKTTSGDIRLSARNVGGPVRLETVSGDIEAALYAPAGAVEFHTVSGDVEASVSPLAGPLKGRTVSGDMEVSVRGPVRASLVTRGGDADIHIGGKSLRGKNLVFGTDGFPCELTSVSGDLTLRAD